MESLKLVMDGDKYDKAVYGGLDANPVLKECGDLALYLKPNCTVGGKPGVVLTFTVQLPDGTFARAQATTTAALIEQAGAVCRGWREGGHV